jgi:hypothetical protein
MHYFRAQFTFLVQSWKLFALKIMLVFEGFVLGQLSNYVDKISDI